MAATQPQRISGPWREGYALDLHVIRSEFRYYDGAGNPQFDTVRSELGELLYRLKYRSDQSVVPEIVETAAEFLEQWNPQVDLLIPATPSNDRKIQPVALVAQALAARLGIVFSDAGLTRNKSIKQLKRVRNYAERSRLLSGAHHVDKSTTAGRNILLLDDLYQSGATLREITADLYDKGEAQSVFVLAITRTRG